MKSTERTQIIPAWRRPALPLLLDAVALAAAAGGDLNRPAKYLQAPQEPRS